MRTSALVPAAGKGARLGSKIPKQFLVVSGKPILIWTLETLAKAYPFQEIIVAADPSRHTFIQKWTRKARLGSVRLVRGGATRSESVRRALESVSPKSQYVLVHDAARPLASPALIQKTLLAARKTGGAICAIPESSTVKRVNLKTKTILKTEDRSQLYLAQTPQVFKKEKLLERYRQLGAKAALLTDEASFFDGTGLSVKIVEGEPMNIKITTSEDLERFKLVAGKRK